MRRFNVQKRAQQGATLIVALVFLLVLTVAGVTAMRFSTSSK
jgi:Tfp pilus assembly protein PilX